MLEHLRRGSPRAVCILGLILMCAAPAWAQPGPVLGVLPEPASLALVALGGLGIVWLRFKRRR